MKMKQTLCMILGTLLLAGCGGGGSSQNSGGYTQTTSMKEGETYTVHKGDQIVKSSSEKTVIHVTHIDGHEESAVTLVSGSATIKHP